MTRPALRRLAAYALLAPASCWAAVATAEMARLSPIVWPVLLPRLVLTGIPAAVGAAAGAAWLAGRRSARPLTLAFALTLIPAVVLTLLGPGPLR